MHLLNYTHRIIPLVSLLALAACELPTKLGNLSDSTTDATTIGDATDSGSSEGTSKDTDQTTGWEPSETSAWSTTSSTTMGPSETTTPTTSSTSMGPSETWGEETTTPTTMPPSTTFGPGWCESLGEDECELEGCMPLYGVAYDFPGCSEGQVFLGCIESTGCDDSEPTFCKDGTDEAYKRQNGCVPPGFTECEPPALAFCGSCEALDEAACMADAEECQPIYGAPHVELEGEMCVDYEALKFLLCISNGGACPPFVPTLCPLGSPEEAYDVPSGCLLPGFEQCEGGGTPECP